MELIVFVMLVGTLAGWLLGSAATRFGRAGRDVAGAKTTWEKAVQIRSSERWKTLRTFALIGGILVAILWMMLNVPPDV